MLSECEASASSTRTESIVTANDLQPDAEAVAVRGGHFVAVGYCDEVTSSANLDGQRRFAQEKQPGT
jgi:predicted amidohydrolase YtcJ